MEKVIVITGASSGIGLALKNLYEKDKQIVINLSNDVKTNDDKNMHLDVSNREEVFATFGNINKIYGKIDMLINCAGYGVFGAVELLSEEKCRRIMDVNFFGSLWCCQAVLQYMERGAKIINIASACALFSLPFRALYSASKSAVLMMSYGLGMELKNFGIEVTAICPGDIKTNFSKNRDISLDTNNKYGERIKKSCEQIEKRESKRMELIYASKKIYNICNKKHLKPMYVVGRSYKMFNFGKRVVSQNVLNNIINSKF